MSRLTEREVSDQLLDAPFVEAAGVLNMIARTPKERELYDARLKQARDEEARLQGAIQKGREEGREEGEAFGEVLGQVQLLQQLLGDPPTPAEQLRQQPLLSLRELTETLQLRLRSRDAD